MFVTHVTVVIDEEPYVVMGTRGSVEPDIMFALHVIVLFGIVMVSVLNIVVQVSNGMFGDEMAMMLV